MKKIVVIEDSYLLRQQIVDLLKHDFIVYETESAHRALELIEGQQIDYLLLNPLLAQNSGFELLYEVNSWIDLRSIKTIILTHEVAHYAQFKKTLKELNVVAILSFNALGNKLANYLKTLHKSKTKFIVNKI